MIEIVADTVFRGLVATMQHCKEDSEDALLQLLDPELSVAPLCLLVAVGVIDLSLLFCLIDLHLRF